MGNRSGKFKHRNRTTTLSQTTPTPIPTTPSPLQTANPPETGTSYSRNIEKTQNLEGDNLSRTVFENDTRPIKQKASAPTRSRTLTDLPSAGWEILYEELDFSENKILGRGGFGCVQLATWRGTYVAVKTLFEPFDLIGGDFQNELNLLCRLQHPNIVQLLGFCSSPSRQCLVTEYLHGGSLSENLARMKAENQLLDISLFLKIASDISKGMNCLHNEKPPIIHRDLKSANILVNSLSVDVNVTVKVADFGISKEYTPSLENTRYQGTFLYMAPEVFSSKNYTTKVDVFSFGVILWEMLTLEKPWSDLHQQYQIEERIVQGIRPAIPPLTNPAISQLISECWSAEPHFRPPFSLILSRLKDIGLSLGIGDVTSNRIRGSSSSSSFRVRTSASTRDLSEPSHSLGDFSENSNVSHMNRSFGPAIPQPSPLEQNRQPRPKRHQKLTINSNPNSRHPVNNSPGNSNSNRSGVDSLPNSINSSFGTSVKLGPLEAAIVETLFSHSDSAPWNLFCDELVKSLNARPEHINRAKSIVTIPGTDIVVRKQFFDFLSWFSPLKKDESIYEGSEEENELAAGVCFAQIDELFSEPWFHGFIDSEVAGERLRGTENGTFLVRFSQGEPGNYAISINDRGRIRHWKIVVKESKFVVNSKTFLTLSEVVANFHSEKLESRNGTVQLLFPCPKP